MFKLSPVMCSIFFAAAGMTAQAKAQTEDAARALVDKAVAHVMKHGIEAACKDFANPAGGFIKGELYIYVQDMQAKMICHATNPRLNGKDLVDLKDADGKRFSKEMVELVKTKRNGWVNYRWVNPVTKQIEKKSSYVERLHNLIVGAGIYRE